MDDLLTTHEAAELLGYHPDHMRKLLQSGKVRGRQFGRSWMIDRSEVERIKALQGPGGRLPKSKRR